MMILNMRNRILLSVYAIYCMRKLKSPMIAESFVLAILATFLFYFVSVPSVLTNMQSSENSYRYFLSAISEADLMIKGVLVAAGITSLLFIRNIATFSGLKQRFT